VQFGTAFTAGYRPDGLRAWKQTTNAASRHYFLYDGGHIVAELDSAGALLSAYGWGAAGLSERYEAATGTTYAYTFDPSGNLLQRHTNNTANNGTPIYADYSTLYDGFGGQRGAVTSRSGYALVNQDPVGWGGQWGGYTDQETVTPPGAGTDPLPRKPLVLLGHRYYDPGAGRFLNRDPEGLESGINVYAYCTNNPIRRADPSGLDALILWGRNVKNRSFFENLAEIYAADYEQEGLNEMAELTDDYDAYLTFRPRAHVVHVESFEDIQKALKNNHNIDTLIYVGHAGPEKLYLSNKELSVKDVTRLDTSGLTEDAKIHLWGCDTGGATASGGINIAQAFANHFKVNVEGVNGGLSFGMPTRFFGFDLSPGHLRPDFGMVTVKPGGISGSRPPRPKRR